MNVRQMLKQMAMRYEHGGPISRQRDAAALLRLADALDEDGARTYLARFVSKWRIEQAGSRPLATASPLVRRRPMPELEQRVYAELAQGKAALDEEKAAPIIITTSESTTPA